MLARFCCFRLFCFSGSSAVVPLLVFSFSFCNSFSWYIRVFVWEPDKTSLLLNPQAVLLGSSNETLKHLHAVWTVSDLCVGFVWVRCCVNETPVSLVAPVRVWVPQNKRNSQRNLSTLAGRAASTCMTSAGKAPGPLFKITVSSRLFVFLPFPL